MTGAEAAARVSLSSSDITINSSDITINLGKEWGRTREDDLRSLVITFNDVTAGLSKTGNTFTSSSSARGGNLRLLTTTQPTVTVGNILGVNVTEVVATPARPESTPGDPLSRNVDITPVKVYPDEKNHRFTITFTAPGPMDGGSLEITIPPALHPTNYVDANSVNASGGPRVLGRRGAVIGDPGISGDVLTVPLTTIAKDQTVVITYTIDIPDNAVDETPADSAFSARTTPGSDTPVTKITGGLIGAEAGSGRMQISPVSIENGQTSRTFTLTYTAYAAVTGDIVITPDGIVLKDDTGTENVTEELQTTSSGAYGHVIGSASPSGNTAGTLQINNTATPPTITWQGVETCERRQVDHHRP